MQSKDRGHPSIRKSRHKRDQTDNQQPYLQCCPSVTETISPLGGISRNGDLLELYREHNSKQTFYQTSCLPQIENKPCRFIDKGYKAWTKCIQKYTYSYALVKDFGVSDQKYRIDFIRVKSACKCEIVVI